MAISELNQLLAELAEMFPPKEDAPIQDLPIEFNSVIEKAKSFGINIPTIVISETPSFQIGSVDFNTYSEMTIILYRNSDNGNIRSNKRLLRTLAHELGHCEHIAHGLTYENWGWKNCEDHADMWREILLD